MVLFGKQSVLAVAAASAALPGINAGGPFYSRPDIIPPVLNITVPAADPTGSEYIFITPYSLTAIPTLERPGAYILRKDGDLVWSGTGYYVGFVANFHPTTYGNKPVLQAFQGAIDAYHGTGFGQHVLLDQNYQHVATAIAGNHRIPSLHEFTVVDGETALIEIYVTVEADLTAYGGNSSQQWIGDGLFQEFDIRTGDLVFEWSALDHLDPADSLVELNSSPTINGLSSKTAWDFAHLNSVDKDAEGNYLLSSRHFSSIYKINGTDGSVIWTLGGRKSDFTQVGNWEFGFQHDARWHPELVVNESTEVISFFDNSGDGSLNFNNKSRALIVEINQEKATATILREAPAPYGLLATSQGNTQVLSSNNLFVNWGSEGAFTEFSPQNEILYHAFIDQAISYRGFLAKWKGTPTEDPALAALETSSTSVTFYVSWNGDTETAKWKFYSSIRGTNTLLGQVSRESFESTFTWVSTKTISPDVRFYAEAIGHDNKVRARTVLVERTTSLAYAS